MKIILLQDVRSLGKAGDIVKVSDGYARNMLFPKKLAKEATDGNIKALKNRQAEEAARQAERKAEAETIRDALKDAKITLYAKGGDAGRLFGSVTNADVADAVKEQTGFEIDRKKISIPEPIKTVGEHVADAKLFTDVSVQLHLDVVIR